MGDSAVAGLAGVSFRVVTAGNPR
ncbi:MAG: hypothetical protein AB7I30_18180 [Isosphaeraceae bacterium]